MKASRAPAPGTWLRPVGGFAYRMRITASEVEDDGLVWIEYETHRDGDPKPSRGHSVNGLREIRPGIWRDTFDWPHGRWSCCPVYYRAFVPAGETGMLL